jgi:DNA-binding NtrC family response regulator
VLLQRILARHVPALAGGAGIPFADYGTVSDLLVVDDDRDIALPLIMFLEIQGHHVRYAENGLAALHAIGEKFPDLILLDIEMPHLSGPELAYRLLVEDCGREKIPILVLSGVADLPSVAKRIGTPYFLSKPFSLDELATLVNRALTDRAPPHPMPADKAA